MKSVKIPLLFKKEVLTKRISGHRANHARCISYGTYLYLCREQGIYVYIKYTLYMVITIDEDDDIIYIN